MTTLGHLGAKALDLGLTQFKPALGQFSTLPHSMHIFLNFFWKFRFQTSVWNTKLKQTLG